MSDPRPTARDAALAIKWPPTFRMTAAEHFAITNALEAAFAADRAASDAREDRLRDALDHVANCRFLNDGEHCAECLVAARAALAAVHPRSDR